MIVVWQVTEHCNLACPFCRYDRNFGGKRREADPAAIQTFGRHLAEYQRETGRAVLVSWLGGEPLLWKPLQEISKHYCRCLGLRVATTTNGTTLGSQAMRRHLLEDYSELTVSVDAPGSVHDQLRGSDRLYATLAKNVRALANENQERGSVLRLRANIVLMQKTIGSFSQLCAELAEWGITEISFNQLGGNDRPEFYPDNRLRPEDLVVFENNLPGLRAKLSRQGVKLLGTAGYLRRMNASSRDEPVMISDCRPGRDFLFIDIEGRIAPCSFTSETSGIPTAEIESFKDLVHLAPRFASGIAKCRPTACNNCLSTRVFEKFTVSTL
jgi:MoaA/NifB/PqqE/SkfB family radical SAM enzyme